MSPIGGWTPTQVVRRLRRLAPDEQAAALGENAGETLVGVFRAGALVRRYALVPSRGSWLIVREI